jgi:phospholipid/cholesterol/gamma-HCH transport system substrate-binding protein
VSAVRFSKPTLAKVIAFAAISMVFTAGLAMKIGNWHPLSHYYTLNATFSDAAGVFKGDAVKLAGVNVGGVAGSRIENGRAVVTFKVQDSVKVPRDSIVGIRWRNVLGQRFIYLYPGRQQTYFQPGQTVPLSQTDNAGDLDQFLNRLGPILRAIDPEKANEFLDAMNAALAGNEVSVRQLLDDGAVLATRLNGMDRTIQSLISSSDTILGTYAAQDHAVASILDDLDSVGGRLHAMTGDVDSVVTNFAAVQQQLNTLLTQNRGNIDATVNELASVSTVLARNKQRLAETLCTVPAGVSGYFQTTSWGEWFNVRIVQVQLRDQHSDLVTRANELPQQRGGKAPPVYKCPGSQSPGNVPPGPGSSGAQVGPGQGQYPEPPGFENIGGFVHFVLGGTNSG